MKYCLLFVLLPFTVLAQPKQYMLSGYIAVPGGESFTYKLYLTDSAGKLGGYSLTYLQQVNDTKAAITATIDRTAQTLTFHETEILYNHGFYSNAIMCLANAKLQYKNGNKGKILTGSIRTKDLSNTDCGGGTITFVNEDELARLFSNAVPKSVEEPPVATKPPTAPLTRKRTIVVSMDEAPVRKPVVPVADEITNGTGKTYVWHSDTVVLDIWDGGRIDEDIVTVMYNDNIVLTRHTLTADRKQLRIPLSGQAIDVITIVANNEGNEPPNTANILLHDGDITHEVIAYNDRKQSAEIKIKRVKK